VTKPPIVVEVTRGGRTESAHTVDAAIVDTSGSVVEGWGDIDRMVMPRSAIKPIQALPLVRSGAADAYRLSDRELALACASHNGESRHVDAVTDWLDRIGLDATVLECGSHAPIADAAASALWAGGQEPDARHNNCSGKHTGFLSVCRHLGFDPSGYVQPTHDVQVSQTTPAIEELCHVDLSGQTPAIDGCGIPVWSIPMTSLAAGWARLPSDPAGRRLIEAMMAEPFYVAGTDRSSTRVMEQVTNPVAVKGGAEGVYCGVILDGERGIALKVRDGASRASDAAISHLLAQRGLMTPGPAKLRNWAGSEVGEVRVSAG
jgi:L-asparaginase II